MYMYLNGERNVRKYTLCLSKCQWVHVYDFEVNKRVWEAWPILLDNWCWHLHRHQGSINTVEVFGNIIVRI